MLLFLNDYWVYLFIHRLSRKKEKKIKAFADGN